MMNLESHFTIQSEVIIDLVANVYNRFSLYGQLRLSYEFHFLRGSKETRSKSESWI